MGCTKCKHGSKAMWQEPCHTCISRYHRKGTPFTEFDCKEDNVALKPMVWEKWRCEYIGY
jgi:hypothetical protein